MHLGRFEHPILLEMGDEPWTFHFVHVADRVHDAFHVVGNLLSLAARSSPQRSAIRLFYEPLIVLLQKRVDAVSALFSALQGTGLFAQCVLVSLDQVDCLRG